MEDGLNVYSIKDLENFSGIKAHTIRIWEKRYSILEPDRTDSNIRMYSESELKKILNVAFLNRNGLKISKIAALDDDQLTGKVMAVSSRNDEPDQEFQPGKLLMSALRFNEEQFTDALMPFISRFGVEQAYINYLSPLLLKAGILWQTGSLTRSQEQFINHTIKKIILVEDSLLKCHNGKSQEIIAMINTSDNLTDNNFLFYKYAMKKRGYSVIFTGGALPATEIIEIHRIKPFRYLVVNSGAFDFARKKIDYFNGIGKSLGLKKVIFTDYPGLSDRRSSERIIISRDPADFVKKLSLLK
ncbi:MAG TPA: MerR family transcriptional regulator [Bacteroidales bacterium]|nr:MerR family transcriptional regulator [Bacteroidales bacterium]